MEIDAKRQLLISFLNEIGANNTAHSGRSLFDHLLGTYNILTAWKCDDVVCIAGGLHSIYGTNIFIKQSFSIHSRDMICQRFGPESEKLVWLFGSLNRPKAIEQGFGIDRRMDQEIVLYEPDIVSLRLIEAANLLEQGASLEKWPIIKKTVQMQINKWT